MVAWFKRIRITLLLLLAAFLVQQYFFPQPGVRGPFGARSLPVGPVLVIAPHSDDESLAAAGLLQQAEAAGLQPQVVLVTGGDGFPIAAQAHYHRSQISSQEMIAFGRIRLAESQTALRALGLPPERLTFLGYADRSLDQLWLDCWREEHACLSPFTKLRHVPYAEALEPGAPLAGERLLAHLISLLRKAHPAVVAYPHPNESHVDHWGLSNFVAAALEHLRRTEPGWQAPAEWLYLVHRGDWPAPKGLKPRASLTPPRTLVGEMTEWTQVPLVESQVAQKQMAVEAYHSQMTILRRFMHSFVRTNELFGRIGRADLAEPGLTEQHGSPDPGAWVQTTADPRRDTLARTLEPGADLVSIWGAIDQTQLSLAIHLAAPLSRQTTLRLLVRPWQGGWDDVATVDLRAFGAPTVKRWPGEPILGQVDAYLTATQEGDWCRARLSLDRLGRPGAVMLAAETWIGGALIDRTAWRVVSLDGR
ncbi:MAG TPA: PIG-L family deacetylase [Symbiobacteriaceae bacterium]|nr:PIG-L family deacetylase [Symbiobacteriaceae bacterium]